MDNLELYAFAHRGGGGITPTGNINITDTELTDVSAYATAQVVDANLVAENIKKNIDILGITGAFEGGGDLPSGVKVIKLTLVEDLDDDTTLTICSFDDLGFEPNYACIMCYGTQAVISASDSTTSVLVSAVNKPLNYRFRWLIRQNTDGTVHSSYTTAYTNYTPTYAIIGINDSERFVGIKGNSSTLLVAGDYLVMIA